MHVWPGPPSKNAAPVVFDQDIKAAMRGGNYHDVVTRLDTMLGLANAVGHGTAEDLQKRRVFFRCDVDALRRRMTENRRGLIDPRSSYLQYWDLVTAAALAYTAFVTPFEVGLGLPTAPNLLFALNQLVNLVFIVDIGVNFVLPVPDAKTGELIRSHRELARRYLRTWFTLDLVSVLPLDVVVAAAPSIIDSENSSMLRSIKLLRVLRLFKLVRVLRASRIMKRWESRISLYTSTRSILNAWVGFTVCLHWMACAWAMHPQLVPTWRDVANAEMETSLEDRMAERISNSDTACTACHSGVGIAAPGNTLPQWECSTDCLTPCEMDELANFYGQSVEYITAHESWQCRAVRHGRLPTNFPNQPFRVWLESMLVAMLQFLGSFAALTPQNTAETFVTLLAVMSGTIIFAMIQGIIVQVLTTGNPDETEFRQNMDALNFMMADNHIDSKHRILVRDFFRKSKTMLKRRSYSRLIDKTLSDELRGDVRYLVSRTLFDGVWFLAACEKSFLEDLSLHVERRAYAKDEKITSEDSLVILVQGACSRGGGILTSGAFWGDAIVTSPVLRDTREAKALAYCEVARISHRAIFDCARPYPISTAYLRYAGLMLATKRALVLASMLARLVASKQPGGSSQYPKAASSTVEEEAKSHESSFKLSKWGMVRKRVDEDFGAKRRARMALFHAIDMKVKQRLSFADGTPMVRIKPGSVIQALHKADGLHLSETADTDAVGFREVEYDSVGKAIGLMAPEGHDAHGETTAGPTGDSLKASPDPEESSALLIKIEAQEKRTQEQIEALRRMMEASEARRAAGEAAIVSKIDALVGSLHARSFTLRRKRNNYSASSHALLQAATGDSELAPLAPATKEKPSRGLGRQQGEDEDDSLGA